MRTNNRPKSVNRIIEAAAGVAILARKLGITPSAISQWHKIPERHTKKVCKITGLSERIVRKAG